jgi:hypothetical protein
MRLTTALMETFWLGEMSAQIMEDHLQPFLFGGLRAIIRRPVLLIGHFLDNGHGPGERFAAILMHFPLNRVLDRENMLAFAAAYLEILGTTGIGPVMNYLVGPAATLAGYDPGTIPLIDFTQGRDG